MEMIVRGSEYQSFLNCRKEWYYGWVEKITPKRPDNKLFFGSLFHKWLELYYNNGCEKLLTDLKTSVWLNEQDLSGMEQTDIDDMVNLMRGVSDYYHKTYGESDKQFNIIATELEFKIRLEGETYYTGTIDLVYEVDGKVRFADHKTVSSISMYVDKAGMDRQISRYWWALKMLANGIGLIKVHGKWVECVSLLGKEIDGFDYNLITKDFPKPPKVLRNKKLSQDKSQKTTYELYTQALQLMGVTDVSEYHEILNHLFNKPDPFLKRLDVKRTEEELESAMWEFKYAIDDMRIVKETIEEHPPSTKSVTYRNIGQQCTTMCQFQAICRTEIEGGNVSLTKNLAYKKSEDR